jgi:hypothetical protein
VALSGNRRPPHRLSCGHCGEIVVDEEKFDSSLSGNATLLKKAKLRRNNIDQNLDLLRNIYGISYVLGYRELANVFPLDFENYGWREIVFVVTSVALVLLSIRFFWGVGVIRRYVQSSIEFTQESLENSRAVDSRPIRKVMSLYVPILLMHSFIFFILCRTSSELLSIWEIGENIPSSFVYEFVSIYAFLLIINSLWLHKLKVKNYPNNHLSAWITNNLLFAFSMLMVLVLQNSDIIFSDNMIYGYGFALLLIYLNSVIDLISVSDAYLLARPG